MTTFVQAQVDQLFARQGRFRYGDQRVNPVTGSRFLHGEDPIGPQKRDAKAALLARATSAGLARPVPPSFRSPTRTARTSRLRVGFSTSLLCTPARWRCGTTNLMVTPSSGRTPVASWLRPSPRNGSGTTPCSAPSSPRCRWPGSERV